MNTERLLLIILFLGLGLLALQGQDSELLYEASLGDAELLNHDINNNRGPKWQDIKRSICVILPPDNLSGTGFLINTTHNGSHGSGSKLFLVTNAHVIKSTSSSNQADLFISFDYEASYPGLSGQGEHEAVGAFTNEISRVYKIPFIKRVVDKAADIALLEVDVARIKMQRNEEWKSCRDDNGEVDIFHPNSPFYNAYAIGWNINALLQKSTYTQIHHPEREWKKLIDDENDISTFRNNMVGGTASDQILEFIRFLAVEWSAEEELSRPGSSGSPIINKLDSTAVAVFFSGSSSERIGRSSALENSWYLAANEEKVEYRGPGINGLVDYLDPDRTWISKVPGGYVRDLIQPEAIPGRFDLTLIGETPPQMVKQKDYWALFVEMFNFPVVRRESRLGAGLNVAASDDVVYLTVSAVDINNPFEDPRPYLLYGIKYVPGENNTEPFGGEILDIGDPSDLQVLNGYNTEQLLPLGTARVPTSNFKANYTNYLILKDIINGNDGFYSSLRPEHHFDSLEVKLTRLTNNGPASKVTAIRIPYLMPYNAVELFQPEELANHWQSKKYRPSRGEQTGLAFIEAIKVQQNNNQIKRIESVNNGGYLNLVNRHYYIEPVLTSYLGTDDNRENHGISMTIENGAGNQLFFYKVWMDFSEGVDAENYYNFVEGGMLSDLIGEGSGRGGVDFEYTMPDNALLGMEPGATKYVRMRVAISSMNNITQDGIYAQGEVEDYLVKLVAPNPPVLYVQDAESSGAQEVVIDQSELTGISTIGMIGGVASDPWHRRLGANSFHFPGNEDYLSLDDNDQFIHDAFTQRTVAFWLYNEDHTGQQDLYEEGGSTHGFGIRLNAGKPELAVRNSGAQVTISGEQSLPLEEWVHLMGVFAEGDLLLYVNGELVAETTDMGYNQIPYHGDAAAWGATQGSNAFNAVNNNFNGWLDDLRVYNVALQQEGVNMLLAQATADITTGRELHHQLDNDYTDASGNNISSVPQNNPGFGGTSAQGSHALAFNQSSYVDLDVNNAFIHDAFTERTVAFWVNSGQTIASITEDLYDEGGATHGIAIRKQGTTLELAVRNSYQQRTISSCFYPNEWIHVAGVFDNGKLQLYINGQLEAENPNVGYSTIPAHGNGAGFGKTNGENAFNQVSGGLIGLMDDLLVYGRALTADEVQYLVAQADITPDPDLCGGNSALANGAESAKQEAGINNSFIENSITSPLNHSSSNTPLQVSPNPSADGRFVVNFELDKPTPVELTVTGLDGRQLVTQTLNPESAGQYRVQLDQTQGLPPGIYLLRVHFGDRTESRKLVIGN